MSLSSNIRGRTVYAGSYAPTRGQVSSQGAMGYLQREVANRNPFGGVSSVGRDGQSDTRSGAAAGMMRQLERGPSIGQPRNGGKTKPPGSKGPITPPPADGGPNTPPPSNGGGPVGGGPVGGGNVANPNPTININANGTLDLPFDAEWSLGLVNNMANMNSELLALQMEQQQKGVDFARGNRDADIDYTNVKRLNLGDHSNRGMAFSSGHGFKTAENARDFNNYKNDMITDFGMFNQNADMQRLSIQNSFNQMMRADMIERANREAAENAGTGMVPITPGEPNGGGGGAGGGGGRGGNGGGGKGGRGGKGGKGGNGGNGGGYPGGGGRLPGGGGTGKGKGGKGGGGNNPRIPEARLPGGGGTGNAQAYMNRLNSPSTPAPGVAGTNPWSITARPGEKVVKPQQADFEPGGKYNGLMTYEAAMGQYEQAKAHKKAGYIYAAGNHGLTPAQEAKNLRRLKRTGVTPEGGLTRYVGKGSGPGYYYDPELGYSQTEWTDENKSAARLRQSGGGYLNSSSAGGVNSYHTTSQEYFDRLNANTNAIQAGKPPPYPDVNANDYQTDVGQFGTQAEAYAYLEQQAKAAGPTPVGPVPKLPGISIPPTYKSPSSIVAKRASSKKKEPAKKTMNAYLRKKAKK